MARAFHEVLGISFQSADAQKHMDMLLYGLTMAWGTEVTSLNLTQDIALVSFAICELVLKEPPKPEGKSTPATPQGAELRRRRASLWRRGPGWQLTTRPEEDMVHRCSHGAVARLTLATKMMGSKKYRIKTPATEMLDGCGRGRVPRGGHKNCATCWKI